MWKSRCARHEQFSFNKFISIVIVRTRVEVCDGEQRFDSSCHCFFLYSGSTRINAANLSQVDLVGYVTGFATVRINRPMVLTIRSREQPTIFLQSIDQKLNLKR